MGSLARQARRQRDRQAQSRPADDQLRLLPPSGVPARLWLEILHEHAELVVRLIHAEENGEDSDALVEELVKATTDRVRNEIDLKDESDEGFADQMEFLLEKYAALVVSGSSPERSTFERHGSVVIEFARGEGASLFAKFMEQERKIRAALPVMRR